ncbi:MAG: HEPN domain-containing protein [Candidatus Helarchaeota archaeon]|nr:HEPN domain-containing protein [Candidatus Helarchaeota archaeon]
MAREEIENWYQQGLSDFKTAKSMFNSEIYDAATFYCEQAVQKLLKATWMKIRKSYPPKTHNISKIGEQLKAPKEIISLLKQIAPFYFISRYPDAANGVPAEIITKKMAKELIQITEEVINWINKQT